MHANAWCCDREVWQSPTMEHSDFSSVAMICNLSGVAGIDPLHLCM